MNKLYFVYSLISVFNAGIEETMISIIFPEIANKFDISRQKISLIFLSMAIGNFSSLILSDFLIKKIKLSKLLIIVNLIQSLNYLLIFIWGKYINIFYLIYIFMFINGSTGCFLEIGYNLFSSSNSKSILTLNILYIFHGLGTITGPILSRKISNYNWYYIYLIEFFISFLLFIYISILQIKNCNDNNNSEKDLKTDFSKNIENISLFKILKISIIIYISIFLMFYFGLELSLGDWFYTYLVEYMEGEKNIMSLIISIYWATQIVGKFFLIIISYFFEIKNLNIISITLFIIISWICIIFIYFNKNITIISIFFSILGFCLGPIHPTAISIINDYFINKNQDLLIKAITICTSIPFLGSSIFPFICGIIIDYYSIKILLIISIILLFIMSITFLGIIKIIYLK